MQQDFQIDGSLYFIAYIAVTCLEGNLLPSCFDRMKAVILIILHRVSLFSYVCAWLSRGLLDCPFPFHYTEADIRRTN